ncbi:MAG: EAL domain-containing protein [Pseudomonadota bacterium]
MNALNRLSLRGKFLVVPAIGFLLTVGLAAIFFPAIWEQERLLVKLEEDNLSIINRLFNDFTTLSINHNELYELLTTPADLETTPLTESGQPLLRKISEIEDHITKEIGRDIALHASHKQDYDILLARLAHYRRLANHTLELAARDRASAPSQMSHATEEFNRLTSHFLVVMQNEHRHIDEAFNEQIARSRHQALTFLAVFIAAMTSMVVVALLLSRLLSGNIQRLIQVMDRLAQGDTAVPIPAPSDDAIGRMTMAVTVFRDTLLNNAELHSQTRHINHAMSNAQQLTNLGSWEIDLVNDAAIWSDQQFRILGEPPQGFVPEKHSLLRYIHPDDQALFSHALEALCTGKIDHMDIEHRIVRPDGSERIVQERAQVTANQRGRPAKVLGATLDITERRLAEAEQELAASVFKNTLDGIMITDRNGTILRVNPAFGMITGYRTEEVIGQTPRILRSGVQDDFFYQTMWSALLTTGIWQGELWNRRKEGEVFPVREHINAVVDDTGQTVHYISIFSDITEKKLSEERIYHLAHYDALTELPNRTMFHSHFDQAVVRAKRTGKKLAVLFLDLDGFKLINDTLGHQVGDALITKVAKRLRNVVRLEDTVARLGGDEFTLLLEDMDNPQDAGKIAQKILDVITTPFLLESREIVVTTSIGISTYPEDGKDIQTLLKHADTAMYRAKELGRNNYQFFTAEMNARTLARLNMETHLRKALERGEFSLAYQPLVDAVSGGIIGGEALLRWHHPEQGMIAPDTFIPVAEESGLIIPIGAWVLREVGAQHMRWRTQGLRAPRIAVNLSARQFLREEPDKLIAQILEETGMPPESLELEITESMLMDRIDETIVTLKRLKAMGVYLAVDDFGTGYSSLAYLKRFPIHKLKIDRSFVCDITRDQDDAAIVKGTIALAHSLNLTVLAEGVETAAQREFLQRYGCDQMQGFYFSRPLAAEDFAQLLASGASLIRD